MTQEMKQRLLCNEDRTRSRKPLMLSWVLLVFVFAYGVVSISVGMIGLVGHLNSNNFSAFFAAVASGVPHGTAWLLCMIGLLSISGAYGCATLLLSERRN